MNAILAELLAPRAGAAVCWLGNAGWLIAAGGKLVATDLDLVASMRLAPPPITAEEVAPHLDALFISHEHGDHFSGPTCRILARESRCVLVVPGNCVDKAREIGMPEERVRVARPREVFELDGIRVEPLRAFHGDRGQVVYFEANLDDCGYILTLAGLRFLQPGDSVLTQDHMTIRDIDVMFVSPTDHNMHVAPAARFIHAIRPRYVFPQHFGTYKQAPDNVHWTVGFPDELRQALDAEMRERFHKLQQGEVFVVELKGEER